MTFAWSYSSLDTYTQCPRRFYHKYILREKEPPSPALDRGNAVHKACESYLKGGAPVDAPYAPLVEAVKRKAQPHNLHVEKKMGLLGNCEPCGFFDDRVWGRGAADVVIEDGEHAFIADWKTGKIREKAAQLAILSLFVFKHFPEVLKITACNIWLEHSKVGTPYEFTREDSHTMWASMIRQIQEVEKSIADQKYDMKPGPLCAYCRVTQCPNNRR